MVIDLGRKIMFRSAEYIVPSKEIPYSHRDMCFYNFGDVFINDIYLDNSFADNPCLRYCTTIKRVSLAQMGGIYFE